MNKSEFIGRTEVFDTARLLKESKIPRRRLLSYLVAIPMAGGLFNKIRLVKGGGDLSMKPAMFTKV